VIFKYEYGFRRGSGLVFTDSTDSVWVMRIAFASFGSLGDLHPLLAMAVAAQGRGHDVAVAASPNYEDNVRCAGVEFYPLRPAIPWDPARLAYYFDMRRGPERLLREVAFAELADTHADLRSVAKGADLLVVGELLYTAPIVAAEIGIPWLNVVLAPTSFLSASDPCVLAPAPFLHPLRHLGKWIHQLAYIAGRIQGRIWAKPYFAFRRSLGLPPGTNPIFDAKHSPYGTLAMFPSFFAKSQPDWPVKTLQAGFPFFEQPPLPADRIVADFLSSGEPPVVFTLGSIVAHFEPAFYHAACEAALCLNRRAVLLTGSEVPLLDKSNPNVLAVKYARLNEILPRSAAVVHAGGIGTCAEALRAGIPSVIIPFSFDQPDNAFRMKRLGVAEILSRHSINPDSIRAKLEMILTDSSFTNRSRHYAAQITPAQTIDAVVDKIESFHV